MVEITNREDLEAWLKDKPRKVAVVIAARAALRVQPVLARIFDTKMSKQRQNALYLQSHRAMLASAVAAAYPAAESAKAAAAYADAAAYTADGDSDAYADAAAYTADGDSDAYGYAAVVVAAAAAAAYAVDAGIDAANAAAYAVAYASAADAAAAAAVWAAVSRDCAEVDPENSGALFLRPIWPDGPPAFIARNETRSGPQRAAPHWSFWHRWYASMRDGHPLNRDLQRNIAAIHSGLWKKGPEHIAELIAGIEAKHAANTTPTSEAIVFDEPAGALRMQPRQIDNLELYQTALDKVRDAIEDLTPEGMLKQHHAALEPVIRKLTRTLDRYADNPQRVHDDFLLYAKQTNGLMESGEVVEDDDVQSLRDTQITGADDIRAADEDVRASVAARQKLRLEEGRVEIDDEVLSTLDTLTAISLGQLSETSQEDAEFLRTEFTGIPSDEAVDVLYRTTAHVSRASIVLRKVYNVGGRAGGGLAGGFAVGQVLIEFREAIGLLLRLFS